MLDQELQQLREMGEMIQDDPRHATAGNLALVIKQLGHNDWGVRIAALSTFGYFVQADSSFANPTNIRLVLARLGDENQFVRPQADYTLRHFMQANPALATEDHLGLVLVLFSRKFKDEVGLEYEPLLDALRLFHSVSPKAFTASNLKLLLNVASRIQWSPARIAIRKALSLFSESNPEAFTESNLREALSESNRDGADFFDGVGIFPANYALPFFLDANPAAFTESNLMYALEILEGNKGGVHGPGTKVLTYFLDANPGAFTPANLEVVHRILRGNVDTRRTAFEALLFFLQADTGYATGANLKRVLGAFSNWGLAGVRKPALKVLSFFLKANPKAFTEPNLNLVLEMLEDTMLTDKSKRAREGALRVLHFFFQANASYISQPTFEIVLERLRDELEDESVRRAALRTIPFFLKNNPEALAFFLNAGPHVFSDSNLKLLLEMLKHKDVSVRQDALTIIFLFAKANLVIFSETNLFIQVLDLMKDKKWWVREAALASFPAFLKARPDIATEFILSQILAHLDDPRLHRAVFKVLRVFQKVNPEAFTESNRQIVLRLTRHKDKSVREAAQQALTFFPDAGRDEARGILV